MCPAVHNKESRGSIAKSTNKVDCALISSLCGLGFKDCDLLLGIPPIHLGYLLIDLSYYNHITILSSFQEPLQLHPKMAKSQKFKVKLSNFAQELYLMLF